MNIKVFQVNKKIEAVLEGGSTIKNKRGEGLEAFLNRVNVHVKDELLEEVEEFILVDTSDYVKKSTASLEKSLANLSGLELALVKELVASRKAKAKKAPAKKAPAKKAPAKKAPAKKTEPVEDFTEPVPAPKKAPAKKAPAKKANPVDAEAAAEKARRNVKAFVSFTDLRTGEAITGQVTGVTVDPRGPSVFYRIKADNGKLYRKSVNHWALKFDREKTKTWKAENAAAEKAKAKAIADKKAATEKAKKDRAEKKAQAVKIRKEAIEGYAADRAKIMADHKAKVEAFVNKAVTEKTKKLAAALKRKEALLAKLK